MRSSQELFQKKLKEAKYIICSCEGAAEREIIEMLLENNLLVYTKEQLVFDGITNYRKAWDIQQKYLGQEYEDKVYVLRIIDSRREVFRLDKAYDFKCEVINVNTIPEIEILYIIHKQAYGDYSKKYKSKMKPSEFCKAVLGVRDIKKQGFFRNLFANQLDALLETLKEYKRVTHKENNLLCITDMLRE